MPICSVWFGGEWDNHEQVWQQKGDAETKKIEKIEDPIPPTHHIFAPVKAPKLGEHIFYVQQSSETPVENRKVRYFDGWVYFNRVGKDAQKADTIFSSRRDLRLHTEGQTIPILFDDGSGSPYLLQLAQLTYQNTKTPFLKLALIDKATNKSMAYIWANTEATRIGMNLGWFQTVLTQKRDAANFGFDNMASSKPTPQ